MAPHLAGKFLYEMLATSFIILLALNGIYASPMVVSDLPSANRASYCLSGLEIKQVNSTICTYYTYVGTLNNCSYFQSFHGLYLFWNAQYQSWVINSNFEDNGYAAYCKKPLLDDCISNATWMYYDGTTEYLHPTLGIEPCNYNNEQCYDSYNNHNSHCIHNTEHRKVNKELRGQYWFEGCHMGEPYFVYPYSYFRDNISPRKYANGLDNPVINFILHWNDIFKVWMISDKMTAAGFAFCKKENITKCNRRWEIYNGDTYVKDTNVYSGKCDSLVLLIFSL